MPGAVPQFEQAVFSGGGTRCFWQGGFLDVVRDAIGLDPARITGVSGGALSAASFVAHRGHALLEEMKRAFAGTDANLRWHDLEPGGELTPHQRIYREVVTATLDAGAERAVSGGPAFQVLLGHPPGDRPSGVAGTAATAAYEVELYLKGSPHFDWPDAIGVDSTLVDARATAAEGRLVELVVIAATIPPIFEIPRWEGRPVIDGGMADQAPMPDPDEGRTLVLLTREYGRLPDDDRLTHVWPSEETPADKIDFTDPDKIQRTWDLGQEDGRAFLRGHGLN